MHETDYAKLEKMACKELESLMETGKLDPSHAEYAQILTDIVKNIKKIEMLDEGVDDDYSERSYRGRSMEGRSMEGGRDYDRRSSRRSSLYDDFSGVRRDSRGRYSRDGGRDHLIARMGELMSEADTEEERSIIEAALRKMQK